MKRILWNSFKDIEFNEEKHIYTLNNEVFISGTQFINKYKKNIFNDKFIENFAKRNSFSVDYVKKLWNLNKEYSCCKGNSVHFYAETFLRDSIVPKISDDLYPEVSYFHNFLNDHPYLKPVKLEYIIYDKEYRIAGTIDCLFVDTRNNTDYYIIDWKTNKQINMKNSTKFKYPIASLDQSEYNIYSLQLMLYKYILEKNLDINVKDLWLVHLKSSNENYVKYDINYNKDIINKLLSNHKSST